MMPRASSFRAGVIDLSTARGLGELRERVARRIRRGRSGPFKKIVRGATPRGVKRDVRVHGGWLHVEPRARAVPQRGWKLHVSATPWSAAEVLRRSLPVLFDADVPFKLAASTGALRELNEGDAGLSQIGKFITAYPYDDDQAVRLARGLHEATAGERGPAVPSDRPLRRGSLVHYRYGAFSGDADDDTERGAFYRAPDGIDDPFVRAGVAEEEPQRALAGRFVPTSVLHVSASGGVRLAVDAQGGRVCVVKYAGRDSRVLRDGSDARDVLRHEAEVMRKLPPSARTPELYDVVEDGGDVYLAMEYVEGHTLAATVLAATRASRHVPLDHVREWATQLAAALKEIHRAGYAFRDVSPRNVIITDTGPRLIDLELAARLGARNRDYAAGTTGFVSPEQAKGGPARVGDDVYGFGAILFLATTGGEPPHSARSARAIRELVIEARPDAGDLATLIARSMDRSSRTRLPEVLAPGEPS